MKIPSVISNNPVLAGGVIIAAIAGIWLATRGVKKAGQDIGGGAVNLVVGIVSGAGNAVVDNALDPAVNPFYDFGTWFGGKIFEATH